LFEAVINAIHAIQDRHGANCGAGRIDITIHRSSQKSLPGTNTIPEIAGFTIVDNGIGFTDANFQSFRTSDSTYKKERGGKGLGRMIWLKAFEKAEIDSVFLDGDIAYRRTFAFTCSESGVQRQTKKKAEQGADHVTRVRLVGAKGHAPDPFGVSIEREVFSPRRSVPEFERFVAARGDNPPAVGAIGHAINGVCVSVEREDFPTCDRVPNFQCLAFASGDNSPTIRADGQTANSVIVSLECADFPVRGSRPTP
jgi:hypothetical protein